MNGLNFNNMQRSTYKKVLLYSGGLDSWLIRHIWKPDICIYVDMETEYSELEKLRLPPDVTIVKLPLVQYSLPNSIIPLRNVYLYLQACNITEFENVEICLGALNGDRINDKSKRFIKLLNKLLKFLYLPQQSQPGRKVRAVMPFKNYSKRELLEIYIREGGKLETAFYESFSCYHPENFAPCLNCKACFRKCIPFIVAGMEFSESQRKKIKDYMERVVLKNMDDYTKNKGKEGKDCLRAIEIIKTW